MAKVAGVTDIEGRSERHEVIERSCPSYASILNSKANPSNIKENSNKENVESLVKQHVKENIAVSKLNYVGRVIQSADIQSNNFKIHQEEFILEMVNKNKKKKSARTSQQASHNTQAQSVDNNSAQTQHGSVNNNNAQTQHGSSQQVSNEFKAVAVKGARRKEQQQPQQQPQQQQYQQREQYPRRQNYRHHSRGGNHNVPFTRHGNDERSYRERCERNGIAEHDHHKDNEETSVSTSEPQPSTLSIKYVDAPLPKVNAWIKRTTTAQDSPSSSPSAPTSTSTATSASQSTLASSISEFIPATASTSASTSMDNIYLTMDTEAMCSRMTSMPQSMCMVSSSCGSVTTPIESGPSTSHATMTQPKTKCQTPNHGFKMMHSESVSSLSSSSSEWLRKQQQHKTGE